MNKIEKAVTRFCADCAGKPLDVTLCTIFYCDLWPHRMGKMGSNGYKTRVEKAFSGKSYALREATATCGLTLGDFLRPAKNLLIKKTHFGQLASDPKGGLNEGTD